MVMCLRALVGLLLLNCMLYGTLRLLLGKRRKLAGSIALYALFLPVFAGTIGLMGMDFSQAYADELQVYSALFDGFVEKGQAYIAAWKRPANGTKEIVTLVAMAVVVLVDLAIVLRGIPGLFEETFDWSWVSDMEDFFVQSTTLYPVIAVFTVLGWALMAAVNMALCTGAHYWLHGAWPW
ncbi:MAG: hypothetical protein IJE07_14840 [Clostridia bacterium]|nr:hypothetical protein [Clostridia bacterium]